MTACIDPFTPANALSFDNTIEEPILDILPSSPIDIPVLNERSASGFSYSESPASFVITLATEGTNGLIKFPLTPIKEFVVPKSIP